MPIAVFDPAALKGRLGPDACDHNALADEGLACIFSDGFFFDDIIRTYVDEEPDEAMANRKFGEVTGSLRVPSGRLWLVGTEYISNVDPDVGERGGMIKMEPGLYEVTAANIDWDIDFGERMDKYGVKAWDESCREAHELVESGLILVNIIAIPIIVAVRTVDVSFLAALQWLGFALLIDIVLGVILYFLSKTPPFKRLERAGILAMSEIPGAIIVFKRIGDADDDRPIQGVKFGWGYTCAVAPDRE